MASGQNTTTDDEPTAPGEKSPTSLNLSDDLTEWADRNCNRLGYRSRSALINAKLAELRAEHGDVGGDQ